MMQEGAGRLLRFLLLMSVFTPVIFPAVPGAASVLTFLAPVVMAGAILPPTLPGLAFVVVGSFGIVIIAGSRRQAADRQCQGQRAQCTGYESRGLFCWLLHSCSLLSPTVFVEAHIPFTSV